MSIKEISIRPKAYSYIRMSTDVQRKGDSHRRQLELSKRYAENNGLDLVETLEDVGISAFKGKNVTEGAFGEFMVALEAGKIEAGSYLLVESFDRISRDSVLNAFELFSKILRHKIVLVTLADGQVFEQDNIQDNAGKIFMTLGAMLRANEESCTKSARLSAAWSNKRKTAGQRKLTSLCPSWLRLNSESGTFDLIAKRVDVVQEIFRLAIEGYGSGAICQMFNDDPDRYPPTDGAKGWHKSYIQKILASPAVYGQFQPHKYVGRIRKPDGPPIDDYFPTVISIDKFNLAQARITQRRINGARRKGVGFANIFTRVAHCANCGSVMGYKNGGDGPKGGKYLRCANAARNLRCRQPGWEYESFESSFLRFVGEVDLLELTKNDTAATELMKATNHLAVIEKTLADLKGKYDKALELAMDAQEKRVSDDLLIRAGLLKAKIDQSESDLQKQKYIVADFSKPATLLAAGENIKAYVRALDGKGAKEIGLIRHKIYNSIRHMISEIIVVTGTEFTAHDTVDQLDQRFIELLVERRYKTLEQQESYMLSPAGQSFYNAYFRYFVVVFKNGNKKLVQPGRQLAANFLDPLRLLSIPQG